MVGNLGHQQKHAPSPYTHYSSMSLPPTILYIILYNPTIYYRGSS